MFRPNFSRRIPETIYSFLHKFFIKITVYYSATMLDLPGIKFLDCTTYKPREVPHTPIRSGSMV